MSEPALDLQYQTKSPGFQNSSGDFLSEFKKQCPTLLDCTEALIRIIEPKSGFSCRRCQRKLPHRNYGHKMVRCKCGTRNFLLAESPYRNIRRPDAWFGYLCVLKKKMHTSTNGLAKLFKTSPSTSHAMYGVYATVIKNEMKAKASVWSYEFIEIFIKRSRETEARKHPNSEELSMHSVTVEKQVKIEDHVENEFASKLSDDEKIIIDLLSTKPLPSSVIYDLARMPVVSVSVILSMLEIKGCIQRLPGDRWSRVGPQVVEKETEKKQRSQSSIPAAVVDSFITFTKDNRHGISRKYLQTNLAMFWFFVSKTRWTADALIEAIRCSPPISGKDVFNDVTPPLVKVCVRVTQLPQAPKIN